MRYLTYIITILLVVLFQQTKAQSSAILQGDITDLQGNSLSGTSITVRGSSLRTAADAQGYFFLNIPEGSHSVQFSLVGYETQIITIQAKAGKPITLDIMLSSSQSTLQQVEIIGRKEQTYKTTRTFIGNKNETAIKDVPQSISYASKELIADQGAMRVGDVVKNFSGVNQFSFYDDLTIRGFRVNGQANTQLLNGLRTSTGFWKQSLANYLERVEVLKGPSSALFGNASPGGVVNRVTKKPLDETRRSINLSLGSFDTFRALADFTGPATKDSSLLYRVNLGYENAQNFRDLMFDKNLVIAPSLTFIASDRTSINFDLVYTDSKSRLDRGQPIFGSYDLHSTPQSLSLNTANDYLNELTYNASLWLNHQINDNLSFNASYLKTGYNESLYEHRTSNMYALDGDGNPIEDRVGMMIQQRIRNRYIDNLAAYFNYTTQTGILGHKIVFGYDLGSERTPVGGSQLTASGYRNAANNGAINSYNPANQSAYLLDANGNPVPNVPHFNLSDPMSSNRMMDDSKSFFSQSTVAPSYYYLQAGYVQDQITIGNLQAMLGMRYEYYTDFVEYKTQAEEKTHSSAWLPRLGLVYTINPNINVYGSYVTGYNPQTAATIANPNAGGPFDPLESNMIEFGTKTSWLEDQLTITAAIYEINQTGGLYGITGEPDLLQQIGREQSRGFELDLIGSIRPNWNIIASYSYNDAKFLESANPEEIGLQKPNTPKNTANIWTRYNISSGLLQGLGIAFGGNFVDQRNLIFDRSRAADEQLTIPSYTVLNAALFYTVGKMNLQLNANNITNKKHWVGGYDYLRLFPGVPQNYLLSLGYSF
ncbi:MULTISPECIES: TonB-dependent receptor [Sphingobacterium]|uniref:TonB-dependent siderophore receptor n=1 Tax=Sphingobacterium populi TaxID=1812824 RepID=A0ABW5UFA4_9SPHI|nr:TonB-dependent receptor [Sphingobacterium sp. CFCC 11742]